MGEISGKHALVEQLHQEGVEYIFGNPGTTELPLMDVLAQRDDLRYILSLHEGVALAMAPGYAEASGKIGVTNFHVAPGLGNALGLVYTAYMGRTPLLVTAGQKDRRMQLGQLGASACLGAAATGDATNGRPAEGHVSGVGPGLVAIVKQGCQPLAEGVRGGQTGPLAPPSSPETAPDCHLAPPGGGLRGLRTTNPGHRILAAGGTRGQGRSQARSPSDASLLFGATLSGDPAYPGFGWLRVETSAHPAPGGRRM